MIAALKSLVDVLFQILEDTEGDPSEVQGSEVESLTPQLTSHSSESLFDTNYSRPASRRSCGHSTPEMHNYSSTYRGMGDKLQSGIKAQRACDPYMNQEMRGMCFDQLHMPKGKELPCSTGELEPSRSQVLLPSKPLTLGFGIERSCGWPGMGANHESVFQGTGVML